MTIRLIAAPPSKPRSLGFATAPSPEEQLVQTLDTIQHRYDDGEMPEDLALAYDMDLTFVQAVLAYWRVEVQR